MKRILAAFLTLAMVLNIAPVGALAASDSDAASIQAVAETEESPSSALDEETARAIASDPFLQGAESAPEEQQQQAEVDTSDVSMTATNSFGQLLVNGMEAQNSTSEGYTDRITNLTMNGHTANVEFVLDGTADLVVAIYTDSDAEEMVASDTVTVTGSGNETAQVTISGNIPETYTVKAFLLDTTEHAPLSAVYTDVSHTQVMVDLDKATVDDFPADRVINLDDQDNTNFAVVSEDTTLLNYQNNTAGENQLLSEDNTSLVYTFGNASAEIKNLQPGDILTYEYAPGKLLIARVQDITVNGDTVTIQGDDTLELTDVFDTLKIEESAGSGELIHSDEGMDPAVTYLGTSTDVDAENKFDIKNGSVSDHVPLVDNVTHEFDLNGTVKDTKNGAFSFSVKGKCSLKANVDFAYYISMNTQSIALSSEVGITGSISVAGAISAKIPLGPLHTPEALTNIGVEAEITPNVVLELSAKFEFKYSYEQEILQTYTTSGGFLDQSKPGEGKVEPVETQEASVTSTVSIFIGLEVGPKIQLGDEDDDLLNIEVKLKGGVKVTAQKIASNDKVKHECEQCLYFSGKLTASLTLKFIILKKDLASIGVPKEIQLLDLMIMDMYWSQTFGEVNIGSCPHKSYRVWVSLKGNNAEGIEIYEKKLDNTEIKVGTTDENGKLKAYLANGQHDLIARVGDLNYIGTVEVKGDATEIELRLEGSTPDPDNPDKPGTSEPTTPEDGRWTLKNGVFTLLQDVFDYLDTSRGPWYDSRLDIREIVTEPEVNAIGRYTFADCTNLTTVTFKGRLAWVDDNAFKNCPAITDVYYAETMRNWVAMDKGKGNECLTNAKIHCSDGTIAGSGSCGEKLTWILDENGNLQITGTGTKVTDPDWPKEKIITVKIGKSVTIIGDNAFEDCINLTKISIPNSVIWITGYAFRNCTSLREIVIPDGVKLLSSKIFENCTSLQKIMIPDSVTTIGERAFENCTSLQEIVIPDSVTYLGYEAFKNCTNLEKITLSNKLNELQDGMFDQCEKLNDIKIPSNVTRIRKNAFTGCKSLTEVLIPDKLTRIDDDAFKDCTSLQEIVIPDSVTIIGNSAFKNCTNLERVTLPDSLEMIDHYTFLQCEKLKEITIPASVTSIGTSAFDGCASLEKVELPKNLLSIGESAFRNCAKLKSLDIPASVNSIGRAAFMDCSLIESAKIPKGVKKIGSSTFSSCENLVQVEIPETVQSIGAYAFYECKKLNSITIPEGVTEIEEYTFGDCNSMTRITLPQSLNTVGRAAFDGCNQLKITYRGTAAQWKTIDIVDYGNWWIASATIHCTDGDIVPDSENSISTGTAAPTTGNKFAATFSGVEAGREYVVIVSRSGSDPLDAGNLLYINQITAQADGELAVPFITAADAGEVKYTVACTRDDAEPDQPVDPGKPDDKPSSGGDGGGSMAIVLVGGVVLVAAVAGVVLMMPVDVQGTVKLADQPVANATVQVLQGDSVAAQTTTNADGWFAVRVRRGSYTLRVMWTDAEGNPVTRTQDFKAPDTSLNIAA